MRGQVLFMVGEIRVESRFHFNSLSADPRPPALPSSPPMGSTSPPRDSGLARSTLRPRATRSPCGSNTHPAGPAEGAGGDPLESPPFAFISSVSFLEVQVLVAPTDIDVQSGGVLWWEAEKQTRLFKPVLTPMFFHATLSLRKLSSALREFAVSVPVPQVQLRVDSEQFALLVRVLAALADSKSASTSLTTGDMDWELYERGLTYLKLELWNLRRQRRAQGWAIARLQSLLQGLSSHLQQQRLAGDESSDDSWRRGQGKSDHQRFYELVAASAEKDCEPDMTYLQSKLLELVETHDATGVRFQHVLLHARLREVAGYRLQLLNQIKNIRLEVSVHMLTYELVRHERCFYCFHVEGAAASVSISDDLAMDVQLEVQDVGGRNMDYAAPASPMLEWSDLLARLKPEDEGKKLLRLFGQRCFVDGELVVPQLEAHLLPLRVRLTYDTVSRLGDYFVYDEEEINKQYHKFKKRFLPPTAVLELDNKQLGLSHVKSNVSGVLQTALNSPEMATLLKDSNPALASALQSYQSRSLPPEKERKEYRHLVVSGDPQRSAASGDAFHKKASRALNEVASDAKAHFHLNRVAVEEKVNATLLEWINDPSKRPIHFVYVRLGQIQVSVSYQGNKQHNIEDFENLIVRMNSLVYLRKNWPITKFQDRLKKDLFRKLLSQVGDALASFIAYKVGLMGLVERLRKNNEEKKSQVHLPGHRWFGRKEKEEKGKENEKERHFSNAFPTLRRSKSTKKAQSLLFGAGKS